jgi:hypothetical protein
MLTIAGISKTIRRPFVAVLLIVFAAIAVNIAPYILLRTVCSGPAILSKDKKEQGFPDKRPESRKPSQERPPHQEIDPLYPPAVIETFKPIINAAYSYEPTSGSNLSATGEAHDLQWMKAPPR